MTAAEPARRRLRVPRPSRLTRQGTLRPVLGYVLAALGALALFLGWYGVSGTPVPAKQVPYLVSGGLTGVALVVLAAAVLAADDVRRRIGDLHRLEQRVETLYALLTEPVPAPLPESGVPGPAPPERGDEQTAAAGAVALPTGTSYHRPGCRLVTGKPARRVGPAEARQRELGPCRLCDPPDLAAA